MTMHRFYFKDPQREGSFHQHFTINCSVDAAVILYRVLKYLDVANDHLTPVQMGVERSEQLHVETMARLETAERERWLNILMDEPAGVQRFHEIVMDTPDAIDRPTTAAGGEELTNDDIEAAFDQLVTGTDGAAEPPTVAWMSVRFGEDAGKPFDEADAAAVTALLDVVSPLVAEPEPRMPGINSCDQRDDLA